MGLINVQLHPSAESPFFAWLQAGFCLGLIHKPTAARFHYAVCRWQGAAVIHTHTDTEMQHCPEKDCIFTA